MSGWKLLVILGAASVIGGVLAFFNPLAASIAVEQLVAWIFLIVGALQAYVAFKTEGWNGKLWTMLLGLLAVLIGVNLLIEPLSGLVTLTLTLGVMFTITGIFKIIAGLKVAKSELKTAVLVSGGISAILGIYILSRLPAATETILGAFLGVELIAGGIGVIALGLSCKALTGVLKPAA